MAEEDSLVFRGKLQELVEQAAEVPERPIQIKTDRREQPIQAAEVAEPLELIQFQPLEPEELVVKVLLF